MNSVRNLLIEASPDPSAAAHYLQQFEHNHPESGARLASSGTGLQLVIAVFAHSRFLSEELLRHPEWIEELTGTDALHRSATPESLEARLPVFAGRAEALPLAQFRRRELLRIAVRDVMGLATLSEVTGEITNVADAILEHAYRTVRSALVRRFGTPMHDGKPCGFSIIALGKLGARELNYSSDIDLMFVYGGAGETDGNTKISNREFFGKVSNSITELLSTYTAAGLCYRVDLRLRPDGRTGEVCISLAGAQSYYLSRARDWELQMLIKARVAAGEPEPGRELLDGVENRIYSSTLDFSAVEAVSATRERIHEKLASRRADSGLDVKLTRGGIRDIEFLVQCLQRLHGGREPWLRHAGTLLALQRLHDKQLISEAEYSRLAIAYEFLRTLEHRLQLEDDRQTHTLPASRQQLELLARRMPARELGRKPSADKLIHRLNSHLEDVQATYERIIHSQQPLYYSTAVPRQETHEPEPPAEPPATNLVRFLDQQAPEVAAIVRNKPLRRGTRRLEAFLEQVVNTQGALATLNANPDVAADVLDLLENSPYFSEELIRRPAFLAHMAGARREGEYGGGRSLGQADSATELRNTFQREMLLIHTESICRAAPIFDTLGRTSDLADAVICRAYSLAREQIVRTHLPAGSYEPREQMMVIALGRLGMREFDLGSDADLNFVLPDEDAGHVVFWTRVAERMIDLISAYTGEGMMFAVDTRLRPNGREGMLVQTTSGYKDYMANRAEAWEGITYMKSRAVIGDLQQSTRFLHEVQDADWRRYGQGGRGRSELREMRARLEREQGESHPLKAAAGGYYDIDFALMYLRLKSAGIFYKVLNTPERIAIIESTGQLDRADAEFLCDAATLYRAIDHGLRVYSGHAEGRLPHSPAHLEALTNLVHRWTPDRLRSRSLSDELERIRAATRQYFRRLFG